MRIYTCSHLVTVIEVSVCVCVYTERIIILDLRLSSKPSQTGYFHPIFKVSEMSFLSIFLI